MLNAIQIYYFAKGQSHDTFPLNNTFKEFSSCSYKIENIWDDRGCHSSSLPLILTCKTVHATLLANLPFFRSHKFRKRRKGMPHIGSNNMPYICTYGMQYICIYGMPYICTYCMPYIWTLSMPYIWTFSIPYICTYSMPYIYLWHAKHLNI